MVDWVRPNVCTDEHLTSDNAGQLQLQKWSVPRLVADLRAESAGDGSLASTIALPGKLLIQAEVGWTNDSPVDMMMLIRVIRSWRGWLTSNPNAVQFRDRWTWAIDRTPSIPVTSSKNIFTHPTFWSGSSRDNYNTPLTPYQFNSGT